VTSEKSTVNGELFDGERLTVNGERLRNRPSCASLTKAEGRKSPNSETIHYSLFTIHLSLIILPLSLLSADIQTSYWGHMWRRPAKWPEEIHANYTPGSDSIETLRVYSPHVYAFLDGYDTRAWVPDHSGNITTMVQRIQQASHTATNSPERADLLMRTNVTARLVVWPQMLERKDALEVMHVGSDTVWGSSAMDDVTKTNGAPKQTDFDWWQDPTSKFWKDGKGSGWMPCFRTLEPDKFMNEWYSDWMTGVVAYFAGETVNLREPYGFSEYLDMGEYNPATYYTFEDLITSTFDCTNAYITSTYRLYYPLFATASRALSLYNRTYHSPGDIDAVTNMTEGAGSVTWQAVGTPSRKVKVEDGEIKLSDPELAAEGEFHVSYSVTSYTNSIAATNWPCSFVSPRAAVDSVVLDVYGDGTAEEATENTSLTALDVAPLVADIERQPGHFGQLKLHAVPGVQSVSYWVTDESGAASRTNETVVAYPKNGEYEVTMTGLGHAGYSFHSALAFDARDVPSAYWLYPSNTTFLADDTHTFIQSFAAVDRYKAVTTWDDINFEYGSPVGDWDVVHGYGYRATSQNNVGPMQYLSGLSSALAAASAKCRAVVGSDFDRNAYAYCGITDWDVENLLNGIGNWTGFWEITCLGQPAGAGEVTADFTFSDSTMTPDPINVISVSLRVSGSANGGQQKYPLSVDTRVKGIIQADWNFPQLKLIQDEN